MATTPPWPCALGVWKLPSEVGSGGIPSWSGDRLSTVWPSPWNIYVFQVPGPHSCGQQLWLAGGVEKPFKFQEEMGAAVLNPRTKGGGCTDSGHIFKEVVQAVLLFGSDTWLVIPRIGRALGGFDHRMARWITVSQHWIKTYGRWYYPPLGGGIEVISLWVGEYLYWSETKHGGTVYCDMTDPVPMPRGVGEVGVMGV